MTGRLMVIATAVAMVGAAHFADAGTPSQRSRAKLTGAAGVKGKLQYSQKGDRSKLSVGAQGLTPGDYCVTVDGLAAGTLQVINCNLASQCKVGIIADLNQDTQFGVEDLAADSCCLKGNREPFSGVAVAAGQQIEVHAGGCSGAVVMSGVAAR
ncbi:MAG: hypothetical protein ACE5E4_06830 [Candidatus Binatia bacterium]